jgi:LysM repeat protein
MYRPDRACGQTMKNPCKISVFLSLLLIGVCCFTPKTASASIFDTAKESFMGFLNKDQSKKEQQKAVEELSVLRPNDEVVEKDASNTTPNGTDEVLKAQVGPLRTSTEDVVMENDQIQVYEVKQGDTLADIAKIYGVTKNTIIWANDIKDKKVSAGDSLLILPVSGVKHIVKKGDTVKSIAKKYKATTEDVASFNGISVDEELSVGDVIIVPDGEMYVDEPVKVKTNKKPKTPKIYVSAGIGYYARPLMGGIKTQGIHGHNAVDIGTPVGTPILAAAQGVVLAARPSGYNGGYGKMVIISHPNGTQTVYGHLSNVFVTTGQVVQRGEQIGESGNTGRSTGPHLHFEIRGAENPF